MNNVKSVNVIRWNFPSEPTLNKSKVKSPNHPPIFNVKKDVKVKSSSIIGATSLTLLTSGASTVLKDGIFWTMFQEYIYPYFLDIATVFVAIKIAQGFYQENRGGKESGSGFNAIFTYGKWLLLFHLIPFFVKLMNEIGTRMSNGLS